MAQEVSFSKGPEAIAEVDRYQEEEPKLHSYESIHRMLQTTYKEVQYHARQVENIIRGTKAELEQSAPTVNKFNYYGKRYRFEEEEERQKELRKTMEVPKPDPQVVCKTVANFEDRPPSVQMDKTETRSAANKYQPKTSIVEYPDRQLHPSFNYRIVFDRKSSLQPQVHTATSESNFPNRYKFLEAKCQKLQKYLLDLKTKQAYSRQHRSTLIERVDQLVPTRQQRDGKIKLDTMFYSKYL